MSDPIRLFRSAESKARYYAAYEALLRQWPVPFEELFIPTRFGDTHVIASGTPASPALILLHSAGSGAVQWYRNVAALSGRHRTYAVDVIGEVNKSSPVRKLTTRYQCVKWMGELLDGLGVEKTDMVGNSFGGFLAFSTALYLPERVNKVVLISPAATFVQIWPFYWHIAFPYKIGYWLGSERMILSGFHWLWQDFPRDECLAEHAELGKTSGFPINQVPPAVYTDEELRTIRTPMLLLIGDHEVIYSPEHVIQRATRLVVGLKAEIIRDANHNAQVTAPALVNKKIMEFLAE